MATEGYNGYTNYETWAVALWIDNEEDSADHYAEAAAEAYRNAEANEWFSRERRAVHDLADTLKSEHEDAMPEVDGVWADLLNSAFGSVDWYDIAENMIGEAKEIVDAEEAEEEEDGDNE